jgi:dipeptidyl aminopeptidase/acylaminoacyl peptidase
MKTWPILIILLVTACGESYTHNPAIMPSPTKSTMGTIPPHAISTVQPAPTHTVEQAIQPYTIDGLRQHDYQGGDIHIREILDTNDVYTRYSIDYPSDGLTITGIMQIPTQGQTPFPVIVMNHGYFYRGDYTSGDGTDRAAEYLNRHGYLTLSSDYRSWGSSDVGPSLFYSGLVIDVINLLNAIPSITQADSQRIGMWGHSMGGGVTVKVLTIDTRPKAAVLYSTVSADDADIIARWGAGCIGDVHEGELLYGCNSSDILPLDLPTDLLSAYQLAAFDPDLLHEISPIYHLDKISAPLQINYGTQDGKLLNGTPPEWSKKLYETLRQAGKKAELFAYNDERHSFIGDNWVAFMERSAHFFDKYVKNSS